MKTALIHEWLVEIGGSEKCVKIFNEIYDPDIFVLFSKEKILKTLGISKEKVINSFLQKIPFGVRLYKSLLPLYPIAVEQYDLDRYDVVLSSSHAAAKGVLTNHDQLHICYCYTPVRYAWHLYNQYLKESGLESGFKSILARIFLHYFRTWDYISSSRVDHYVAISEYIAKRIKKTYNRDSVVIYPPVNVNKFKPVSEKEDYYITVSRIVPYKKVDLIVNTFNKLKDKKLIVIGSGPGLNKLKKIAGKNIEILGYGKEEDIVRYMQKAKAFIFAAEEDFGIVPVEAQACGTPVIAYGRGGAAETVIDGVTGVHFMEQTEDSIINAIDDFERDFHYDLKKIRENSERFSEERFVGEIREFVDRKYREFKEK